MNDGTNSEGIVYAPPIDDIRRILLSEQPLLLAKELGQPVHRIYIIRSSYDSYCRGARKPTTYFEPIFKQLKEEGIVLKKLFHMPPKQYSEDFSELTDKLKSDNRDPLIELEIAFNEFKEKLNVIIPVVINKKVEAQINDFIRNATLKAPKVKGRILR